MRVSKGDTGSLDYGSYAVHGLGFRPSSTPFACHTSSGLKQSNHNGSCSGVSCIFAAT